jgi:hypothetical protein
MISYDVVVANHDVFGGSNSLAGEGYDVIGKGHSIMGINHHAIGETPCVARICNGGVGISYGTTGAVHRGASGVPRAAVTGNGTLFPGMARYSWKIHVKIIGNSYCNL